MLPPITGGLHCGDSVEVAACLIVQVLPPITGGLHCGDVIDQGPLPEAEVLPPITGGLHRGLSTADRAFHASRSLDSKRIYRR